MNRLVILIVEDEPEVRDALARDLESYASVCRIEAVEEVPEAREVVQAILRDGDRLALALCDHLLPGTRGVDFLVELNRNPQTAPVRKVLVTGQAGLQDTIKAVNEANLHHYIAKPWTFNELTGVVRKQLTEYVLDQQIDVLPYVGVLDGERLLAARTLRSLSE